MHTNHKLTSRPRFPLLSRLRRRWVASCGSLFIGAATALGATPEAPLLRDRHGVALATAGEAPDRPRYPFRALAPQLLRALQPQVKADASAPLDLTLDARIQFIAERALRAVSRGAAVVIDPHTGDVLAAASVPSFDPNALDESTRAALAADPMQPLRLRALRALAPGAAFLPVTGLAGLRKGLAERSYQCAGAVVYGTKTMKCWIADTGGAHGSLRLDEALAESCGPFFFQYGNAAGIEEIQVTARLLGLGAPSGFAPGEEDAGIVPGPDYLREIAPQERWSLGYTANTSIGQGFVTATPLQLASVAATIGNGGRDYTPRLRLAEPTNLRADLTREGWTPEMLEVVRHGMWKTVHESGSGQRARVPGVEVAGRTGTAQSWRKANGTDVSDHHTWFIGFAPYDEPTLAICVLVEGAKSGGTVAAPIAGRILAECLGSATEPRVEPLPPATGSFAPIDTIRD